MQHHTEPSLSPSPSTSTSTSQQASSVHKSAPPLANNIAVSTANSDVISVGPSQEGQALAQYQSSARWEAYLTALVLHHSHRGIRYHAGIADKIKQHLCHEGICCRGNCNDRNGTCWNWGILVSEYYHQNEEAFVSEKLRNAGLWSVKTSAQSYDRYSDAETVVRSLWENGWRDLDAIAYEIRRRYPRTCWFHREDPRARVERFLRENGQLEGSN